MEDDRFSTSVICHGFLHPITLLGGLLYLAGTFIMAYNLWRTINGDVRSVEPLSLPSKLAMA